MSKFESHEARDGVELCIDPAVLEELAKAAHSLQGQGMRTQDICAHFLLIACRLIGQHNAAESRVAVLGNMASKCFEALDSYDQTMKGAEDAKSH